MTDLSVFLENQSDWGASTSGDPTRYALQVTQATVSLTKNPIQIAAPKNSPYIFDLGTYKPTITLSGVIDDQDSDNSVTFASNTWRTPTAYQISRLSTDWWYDTTQTINLYIQEPDSGSNSSYFKYTAALANVNVDFKAGSEERPEFVMTFYAGRPKVYYPHMTTA